MKKSNLLVLIGVIVIAMLFFALITLNGSVNAAEPAGNEVDLQNVIDQAVAGDGNITLDNDYEINDTVFIGSTTAATDGAPSEAKSITLDLNGHVISTSDTFATNKNGMIEINGSKYTVTIKDSAGSGKIVYDTVDSVGTTDVCALFIRRGTVEIKSGTFASLDPNNKWGVIEVGHGNSTVDAPASAGTLIMNGGRIESARFGISLEKGKVEVNEPAYITADSAAILTSYYAGEGIDFNDTEIVVNGGQVISESYTAIQNKSNGDVKVTGGIIEGKTGIYSAGGNVEITGGEIIADYYEGDAADLPYGTPGDVEFNGAVVVNENNFVGQTKVTISGGELLSFSESSPAVYLASESDDPQSILNVEKAASNVPIDPEYVSSDVVLSITTEATGTIYFMAGEEDEADIIEILESLEEGTITIEKGDLTVSNLAAGITVENNGTGKVEINGQEVPEGESITVPEADNQEPATDNPELDEEGKIKTGVKGNIAVCALGMLALIGAVTTRRFLK